MEVTQMRKTRSGKNFLEMLIRALRTEKMRVFSLSRNFILFFLSTQFIRRFPVYRGRLKLGKNVRIQKTATLQIHGEMAHIELGDHSIVYENARLEVVGSGVIRIGECGVLGDCRISSRVTVSIGRRALLSWNVFIQDYDSHPLSQEIRAEQVKQICRRFYPRFAEDGPEVDEGLLEQWRPPAQPIFIGDDVWIGANVVVLKGAQIGDGCVVASGSVVTSGQYPPQSVLAGNPARVIKTITSNGVRP